MDHRMAIVMFVGDPPCALMVLVRGLPAGHACPPFHKGMISTRCILLFLTKNRDTEG